MLNTTNKTVTANYYAELFTGASDETTRSEFPSKADAVNWAREQVKNRKPGTWMSALVRQVGAKGHCAWQMHSDII